MNGIFWMKRHFLFKSILRLLVYICIPIAAAVYLNFYPKPSNLLGFSYIAFCACVLNLIAFNVEELAFSEVLLACPLNLKKVWLTSFAVNYPVTVAYPTVLLVVFVIYERISITPRLLICAFLAMCYVAAIQLISTIHLSDYSKPKQWIASIFAVLNVAISVYGMFFVNELTIANSSVLFYFGAFLVVLLIALLAVVLFKKGNPELLLINTKPLVAAVKDNSKLILE